MTKKKSAPKKKVEPKIPTGPTPEQIAEAKAQRDRQVQQMM